MKDAGLGQLWRHSMGVAITAQLPGKRLEMKNVKEVFVAGLLHEIGKVILYVKWPDVGKKIKAVNPSGNRPMMQVEQDLYEECLTPGSTAGWPTHGICRPRCVNRFYTTTNRERHKTPKGECVCNGPAWSRNHREG